MEAVRQIIMTKKYINVRLDPETYNLYKTRAIKMEDMYASLTGKKKRIPIIRVIQVSAKFPIEIDNYTLRKIMVKPK